MKRKILCVFFAVLFVVYLIPTNVFADDDSSYQEVEEGINLGQSSINDDFSKVFLKQNGSKDFSKKSSESIEPSLYDILESVDKQGNVSIYLYIQNPSGVEINLNECYVTISWIDSSDADFHKLPLNFVKSEYYTKVTSSTTDGTIMKFKISDLNFVSTAESATYRISDLDIGLSTGQVISQNVDTKWIYSRTNDGYSSVSKFEGNSLEVPAKCSYYRVQSEALNRYLDIQTTYFAIDNELLNDYQMKDVKVTWSEYELQPILLVDDPEIYKEFESILGKEIPDNFEYSFYGNMTKKGFFIPLDFRVFGAIPGTPLLVRAALMVFSLAGHWNSEFEYGFNVEDFPRKFYEGESVKFSHLIESKLWADNYHKGIESDAFEIILNKLHFCFLSTDGTIYDVKGEEILDYLDENEWDPELFLSVSDLHTVKYSIDDEFKIENYGVSDNYWNYLWNGFKYETYLEETIELERLEKVKFKTTNDKVQFAEKYYIHESDADEFYNFCKRADANSKTVFVLRYQITETDINTAGVFGDKKLDFTGIEWLDNLNPSLVKCYECGSSVVDTTVIKNFDIIQIGMNDTINNYVVFPVGLDPIDFSGDIGIDTPPNYADEEENNPVKEAISSIYNYVKYTLLIVILFVFVLILVLIIMNSQNKNNNEKNKKMNNEKNSSYKSKTNTKNNGYRFRAKTQRRYYKYKNKIRRGSRK